MTPTQTATNTPTPTNTIYYQIVKLSDCCNDKNQYDITLGTVGTYIGLGFTVYLDLGLGDGPRCYNVLNWEITGDASEYVTSIFAEGDCSLPECVNNCPTPSATPTQTPTPTPTNVALVYEITPCGGGETYFANFIAVGAPTTPVVYLEGPGLPKGCYVIVQGPLEVTPDVFINTKVDYVDCEQCQTGPLPSPTQTPTNTRTPSPTVSLTSSVTPTRTPTRTPNPTVTPTQTKTPTVTPSPTSDCVCAPNLNTTFTIYETIEGTTGNALWQNITEWESYLVDCQAGTAGAAPVFTSKPATTQNTTETIQSKSYSYMISFRYVQVSVPSSNIRIAIGQGINGNCSFGVYDIPNPVSGNYYTLRVDVKDLSLYGQLRVLVTTPVYASYNICTNPGSLSCCYSSATNAYHPGIPRTCPNDVNGCISQFGYWCPF